MAKQWQLSPVAPADFLARYTAYGPAVAQMLYNRGYREAEQIELFLHPEQAVGEYDPLRFRNMAAAIDLVIEHIKRGSDIVVCGDYDADGVTSSAIMAETLRVLKGKVEVWIPSRFGEGYGLNKKIVEELAERKVGLLITVDNGIRAKEEVALAKSLGMDVIVTDHHEGPQTEDEMPGCLVINPILPAEIYPYKFLCGAGVAYKFAQALISRSTLSEEDKKALSGRIVDLAAVGTISDCVSLSGENRLIVKQGLELMNRTPRRGLKELMEVSKLEAGSLTAWNVSWQMTPRLNAAGRIDHANAAYALLAATSVEEARKLATDLNEKNIERQRMTEELMKAGIALVEAEQMDEKLLAVTSPDLRGGTDSWPEGIIGLVAGRIAEKFSKPCFVIALSEGKIKGSGRSIEQFDLGASLEAGKDHLVRYGGHKMACGFTVKSLEDLPQFIAQVRAVAEEQLAGIDLTPILKIDAAIGINDVKPAFIESLDAFLPYGQDNPEPKFVSYGVMIEDVMTMGADKRHIKFRLGGMWGVAFSKAEEWKEYKIGQRIDVVYTVCFNVFNGRRDAQLKIIDLRPAEAST